MLTALYSTTIRRTDEQISLELAVEAYIDRLAEYPADIVEYVLRTYPDHHKWWPAWAELREELAYWNEDRIKLKKEMMSNANI